MSPTASLEACVRNERIRLALSERHHEPFWTTVARRPRMAPAAKASAPVLCNTDESPAKEHDYVRVPLQKQVDGFLLVPSPLGDAHLRRFHNRYPWS